MSPIALARGAQPRRPWTWLVLLAVAYAAASLAAPPDERLLRLPKTGGWIECRSANFTIYSDASAGKTRDVAVHLERFRQTLQRITRGFRTEMQVPTSTFVFKNDVVFAPYKVDRDGRVTHVSGYFMPRPFHNTIALDISAGARPMSVVYHEYFHAVIEASLGDLPVWLDEGLAEYFSTFKDRDGSTVEVGHPIEEHLRQLGRRQLIPWDEVFETTHDSPTYNEATRQGAFYAQAWLLVHYLNSTDTRSQALGRYLTLLREGKEERPAFVEAFGKSPAEIGAEAEAYLQSGSNFVRWDFGEEYGEVEVSVETMKPAEVLFRLGELLSRRECREAAAVHLEAARAAGWPSAEIAGVEGLAAYYAQQPGHAEPRLRQAVGAGIDSIEPYVVLSWILLDRFLATPEARGYPSQVPQAIVEIRGLLEKALKLDDDDYHALTALARTYLFDPGDVAPGLAALDRAQASRPRDVDQLSVRAALLGRAGRPREAWMLIRTSILPDDPEKAREAGDYVANGVVQRAAQSVESGDREGAVALLDEAVAACPDSSLTEHLASMRQVVASGGRIVFTEDADESRAAAAIEEYNRAVELASSGEQEQALELLERLAADSPDEEIRGLAAESAAQLRQRVEHNRVIRRINEAVAAANGGDRRGAVGILRELESEIDDPQMLGQVREVLRSLGARVASGD